MSDRGAGTIQPFQSQVLTFDSKAYDNKLCL